MWDLIVGLNAAPGVFLAGVVLAALAAASFSDDDRRLSPRPPAPPPGRSNGSLLRYLGPLDVVMAAAVALAAGVILYPVLGPKSPPARDVPPPVQESAAPAAPAEPAPAVAPPEDAAPGARLSPSAAPGNTVAPPAASPGGVTVGREAEWCARGEGMLASGEFGMAIQAFQEAQKVRPGSARADAGLRRARSLLSARAEQARQEEARAAEAAREAAETGFMPAGGAGAPGSPTGADGRAAAGSTGARGARAASSAQERPAPHGSLTPPRSPADVTWDSRQDARFHAERGDQLLARGSAPEAVREYEKALQSDPWDQGARSGLYRARRVLEASPAANAPANTPSPR